MGAPIVPEYGTDCPDCTPSLFAAGKTPKYIKIKFSGLVSCPGEAPIGDFHVWVTQDPVSPCLYESNGDPRAYLLLTEQLLTLTDEGSGLFIFWSNPPECTKVSEGVPDCTPSDVAKGGTATLEWKYATELLNCSYHLCPLPKTWAHWWDHPDYTNVYRFCCRQDHTRVHVLFDDNLAAIAGP